MEGAVALGHLQLPCRSRTQRVGTCMSVTRLCALAVHNPTGHAACEPPLPACAAGGQRAGGGAGLSHAGGGSEGWGREGGGRGYSQGHRRGGRGREEPGVAREEGA